MYQSTLASVNCTALSNTTTFEQRTVPSSQQQKQKPMKTVPLLCKCKCKVTADTHCNYTVLQYLLLTHTVIMLCYSSYC